MHQEGETFRVLQFLFLSTSDLFYHGGIFHNQITKFVRNIPKVRISKFLLWIKYMRGLQEKLFFLFVTQRPYLQYCGEMSYIS